MGNAASNVWPALGTGTVLWATGGGEVRWQRYAPPPPPPSLLTPPTDTASTPVRPERPAAAAAVAASAAAAVADGPFGPVVFDASSTGAGFGLTAPTGPAVRTFELPTFSLGKPLPAGMSAEWAAAFGAAAGRAT